MELLEELGITYEYTVIDTATRQSSGNILLMRLTKELKYLLRQLERRLICRAL